MAITASTLQRCGNGGAIFYLPNCRTSVYTTTIMSHHIDINNLSEEQLVELNHRIIERLKLVARARSTRQLNNFNVGDRVWFEGHDGEKIKGIVTRLNVKTATIMTASHRWNVNPRFLRKIEDLEAITS